MAGPGLATILPQSKIYMMMKRYILGIQIISKSETVNQFICLYVLHLS